ncbi:MAG: hypothetical protein KY449_11830 [Proteobacteria bacterium]|nr:hypothetical protein [Pseudomonadota bacterium]
MKPVLPLLLALALGACATPYGAPVGGVAETRITEDRYRVSFEGRGGPDYAFDQALVRAAHLTLRDGRQWFVVEDRFTEADRGYGGGPTISLGGSNFSFGRRSASSFGAGIGFQLGDFARPRAATSLQIRTGSGQRAEGAYDAQEVIATVGPRVGPA